MEQIVPRMRDHLLKIAARRPEKLMQDDSGVWTIDLPGFTKLERMMLDFCQMHQVVGGPDFAIDFDGIHDRILEMEPYLRSIFKQPESYPHFTDVKSAINRGNQSKLVRYAARA